MTPEEKLEVIELLDISYKSGWDNALIAVAREINAMKAFPEDTKSSFAVYILMNKGKYEKPGPIH